MCWYMKMFCARWLAAAKPRIFVVVFPWQSLPSVPCVAGLSGASEPDRGRSLTVQKERIIIVSSSSVFIKYSISLTLCPVAVYEDKEVIFISIHNTALIVQCLKIFSLHLRVKDIYVITLLIMQELSQAEDKTAMTLIQNKGVPATLSWQIPTRRNLVIL